MRIQNLYDCSYKILRESLCFEDEELEVMHGAHVSAGGLFFFLNNTLVIAKSVTVPNNSAFQLFWGRKSFN